MSFMAPHILLIILVKELKFGMPSISGDMLIIDGKLLQITLEIPYLITMLNN